MKQSFEPDWTTTESSIKLAIWIVRNIEDTPEALREAILALRENLTELERIAKMLDLTV